MEFMEMERQLQDNVTKRLQAILEPEDLLFDEPMKDYTTFRVGGPAKWMAAPQDEQQLRVILKICRKLQIPCFILGRGSNLLVSDAGYRGVIIQLYSRFAGYEILHDNCESAVDKADVVYIRVQSGMSIIKLASIVAGYSLSGMEFASGIPGSIGGGIMMNAGAYGGEMKDIVVCASIMDEDGNIRKLDNKELEFGYRTSVLRPGKDIVIDVVIALHPGNQTEIRGRMAEIAASRKEKQPLEYPSAGSTFKRPEGYFAGKLISDAGLKGFTCGGACVSEKHAGFVVNKGNATAADVIKLTDEVSEKIYELNGVKLELEVKKLGFEE